MDKKRLLIIDDEKEICGLIKRYLESGEDFEVVDCFDGRDFEKSGFTSKTDLFDFINKNRPDLILLDLSLPGLEGFDICKILKSNDRLSLIPIIIVSGNAYEFDKVAGLNLGADDYLVKPFSLDELKARIKAVLRRSAPAVERKEIHVGSNLIIYPDRHTVVVKGKNVELTPTEFDILELLSSRKGCVFSRETILEHLWGSPTSSGEHAIDVHVRHLREKLGETAKLIKSVRGIGYKLEEDI